MDIKRFPEKMGDLPIDFSNPKRTLISGLFQETAKVGGQPRKFLTYIPEDLDYVYICENNTIYGTKYKKLPNTKGRILVSDVSSCFLSEPMDVTNYGVVYGGVQKNIGPAGVVIAIIREDLITDDVLAGNPNHVKVENTGR